MLDDADRGIGPRIREIRHWRQMTMEVTAGLAGLSWSYLGELERGEKPVSKKAVLEALATALRVAPTELTNRPWTRSDPIASDAHEALARVESVLDEYDDLGVDPEVPVREWDRIAADVDQLVTLRVRADYAAQGDLLPELLPELHAVYVRYPHHREPVLKSLVKAYHAASITTRSLGGRGLPLLAARMAQQAAEELELPAWRGYAAWIRHSASGSVSRARQYHRCVRMADELSHSLDDLDVVQAFGMLHLSAAGSAAARGDRATVDTHVAEARNAANRLPDAVGEFGSLWFGTTNVGIWTVGLRTELGDGPAVRETADTVRPELIPGPGRQAAFWCDLGRALISERGSQHDGLSALLRAEKLAPQRVHTDPLVREGVGDALRRARRDAGGREVRGLAHRMGIAPLG